MRRSSASPGTRVTASASRSTVTAMLPAPVSSAVTSMRTSTRQADKRKMRAPTRGSRRRVGTR